MSNHFDLIVIGWGKAGKTVAKKAAAAKKTVAIIEQSPQMYGGTCINIACLPTKSMVHAAHIHAQHALVDAHGIEQTDSAWDRHSAAYMAAQQHRARFVAALNEKNYHLLADEPTVTVFDGTARFTGPQSVEVTGESGTVQLTGEHIIINTGATSRSLNTPIEGEPVHIHTSTTLLSLAELPQSLAIIGAGFIGLEFASYFANFGTDVTVFNTHDALLANQDEDVAEAVEHALVAQGIRFKHGSTVEKLSDTEAGVDLYYHTKESANQVTRFDQVLVAIGRIPNTAQLNLEAAGVDTDEHGAIVVNDLLTTTNPKVFAAGDVKGGPQFTFVSLDDARIIAPQVLGSSPAHTLASRPVFATCSFLEPPLAHVGHTEASAHKEGLSFSVKKLPTAGIPKAHVIGQTTGINKVLVDDEGFIIGATLMNPEAHEMINLITLAINEQIPASHLGSMIYTHPTFSEALNDLLS